MGAVACFIQVVLIGSLPFVGGVLGSARKGVNAFLALLGFVLVLAGMATASQVFSSQRVWNTYPVAAGLLLAIISMLTIVVATVLTIRHKLYEPTSSSAGGLFNAGTAAAPVMNPFPGAVVVAPQVAPSAY